MAEQPNLSELMQKAQEMQKSMQVAQDELSHMEISGEAGGGIVKVVMTGRHDCRRVVIEDVALRESKDILQDLIAAAINDATRKVEKASQNKIVDLTKAMGLPTDLNLPKGEGEGGSTTE